MGEVGVHLAEDVRALLQPPGEAGGIGRAETHFDCAMYDIHPRVGGKPVGDLPRSVRRAVVDHDEANALGKDRADNSFQILGFVVGGENDEDVVAASRNGQRVTGGTGRR